MIETARTAVKLYRNRPVARG